MRKPTLTDVAQIAGVSAVTVSYVLNGRRKGPDRISAETKERVLKAAAELNYVPNLIARDLRRKATRRICLSVPRLGVPTYDTIAEQLQDSALNAGYHLIVSLSRDGDEQSNLVQQVQAGLADGLVLIAEDSRHETRAELLDTLSRSGSAVVVFDNLIEPRGFDVVRNTDLAACYDAVKWLLESGRARVACLAIRDGSGVLHERVDSYYRALKDADLTPQAELVVAGAETRQGAYKQTERLLELPQVPDAIFACTDVAALSAIRAIQDRGLRVPEDVAVIGAGNIIEGTLSNPPLTSVGPDEHDYKPVFDFLLTRLNSKSSLPGRELITTWSLKLRASA